MQSVYSTAPVNWAIKEIEYFYLNHRLHPNGYCSSRSEWTWKYLQLKCSPQDNLVSYQGHSLGGGSLTSLQRCSRPILLLHPNEIFRSWKLSLSSDVSIIFASFVGFMEINYFQIAPDKSIIFSLQCMYFPKSSYEKDTTKFYF